MFRVTVYAAFYGVCKYADVMYVKMAARLRMGAHGARPCTLRTIAAPPARLRVCSMPANISVDVGVHV